jgi:hypothetical protein
MAHFTLENGLFCRAEWLILTNKMGHFAM